jgi:integrase
MFIPIKRLNGAGPTSAREGGTLPYGSYAELLNCHLSTHAAPPDGRALSDQVVKNISSRLGGWLRFNNLSPASPVGEEVGDLFPGRLAEYRAALAARGLAAGTVGDHVRTLLSLRESLLDLRAPDGLPRTLGRAVQHLIISRGLTRCRVMRAVGMTQHALDSMLDGSSVFSRITLDLIPKLEEYFGLPGGTLSSRVPVAIQARAAKVTCETDYRRYLAEIGKLQYRLKGFTKRLGEEWDDLSRFHIDPAWATLQGFDCETKYTWTIRPGRDYSATEQLHRHQMYSFFGFLALQREADDPRMRGLGMRPEAFSLALLSDVSLLAEYGEFRRARSFNEAANNGTRTFLSFCAKLLYEERGYLWQHPELGARLPIPVSPRRWADWCRINRAKILKLRSADCGRQSRNGTRAVSRDPFVPIREYIHGRQHPLTILWELEGKIEAQLAYATFLRPHKVAEIWRDLLLVKMLAANPLRGGNLAALTYVPARWEDLREPGVLYVLAAEESNFYQTTDGGWRLRIPADYFKVDRGNYDVPVPRSLWATLRAYLFQQRPVLNHALLSAINARRLKEGLAPFGPEQVAALLRCPYVFRYVQAGVIRVPAERFAVFKGTEQVEVRTLRNTMMKLTRAHLPGGVGFGPHACRHLVATEKLKNDPSGKVMAGAALHADPDTVEIYYADVTTGDRLKPWNEEHEKLRAQWEQGRL